MSVSELRSAFAEKFPDANQRFEFCDVQRLNTNDQLAEAFLLANDNNINDALVQAEKSLNFRRESGINHLTEDSFPIELRQKGSIFYRNVDLKGNKILVFRIKDNRRDPAVVAVVKNFVAYTIDLEHRKDPKQQIVLLFDMTGAGLANFDPDLVRFTITCFDTYFPRFLAYLLVFDMPFILTAAWRLIRNWLSEKARQKIIFVKKKDIVQYIAPDQLAPHMGGSDDSEYVYGEENATDGASETLPAFASVASSEEDVSGLRRRIVDDDHRLSRSQSVDGYILNSSPQSSASVTPRSAAQNLLAISPADHLPLSSTQTSHMLVIKNSHASDVAFKVNTTLPNEFRIRPSSSLLAPNESVDVAVSWKDVNSPSGVSRGRLQILALAVASGTGKTAALSLLRSSPREDLWEHRMSCGREPEARPGARGDPSKVGDVSSSSSSSLDRLASLEDTQQQLLTQITAVHALLRRLCLLAGASLALWVLTIIVLLRH